MPVNLVSVGSLYWGMQPEVKRSVAAAKNADFADAKRNGSEPAVTPRKGNEVELNGDLLQIEADKVVTDITGRISQKSINAEAVPDSKTPLSELIIRSNNEKSTKQAATAKRTLNTMVYPQNNSPLFMLKSQKPSTHAKSPKENDRYNTTCFNWPDIKLGQQSLQNEPHIQILKSPLHYEKPSSTLRKTSIEGMIMDARFLDSKESLQID